MCGQGLMLGPGAGKNIASMIVNKKPCITDEAQECFRYDRDFYKSDKEALK